jgi:hypothetical protein
MRDTRGGSQVSERRGLLYGDVPKHNYDLIDLTSLNLDEFQAILPVFEAEFINYYHTV